ncbi:hypothetical protein IWT5_00565 [Secundilactobacillus silagincola]|uniref:Uncharacterized protein n=1 Tax=Secundilactobacillus silagincola TaxID=1714681 RepID=A0A1Z5H567_9LACO|nr:hypothetical protein [Secundilactobacillus silagincola]GAT18292.1 hypothetical protein IWT5_00565 [Secundilactobacillus silagincola]
MTGAELAALKPLLAAYNIELEISGTVITHVNGHEAQLDVTGYMPDQLIKLVLEIVGTDLRAALFKKMHE